MAQTAASLLAQLSASQVVALVLVQSATASLVQPVQLVAQFQAPQAAVSQQAASQSALTELLLTALELSLVVLMEAVTS